MSRAARRFMVAVAGLTILLVGQGPAGAAQEQAAEAPGGLSVTGLFIVAALTLAVPVLFLVATHLRPPVERRKTEEEDLEPVIAGIGQGHAPVPRWLYAVYVLIPAWAVFYLVNNAEVRSELAAPTPVVTAAQGATPPPKVETAQPGGGTAVKIEAKNIVFNKRALSVKGGGDVTVEFRNADAGTPHNFALYKDSSLSETIFRGDIFNGVKTMKHTFPAPAPGTYYFQCDVHPTMNGSFAVA